MEFLIWLLQGRHAVSHFAKDRIMATPGSNMPLKDDHFFMLQYDHCAEPTGAVIRSTVERYICALYNEPGCTGPLREILDIVRNEMLVIGEGDRAGSEILHSKFRGIEAAYVHAL
jgi:hypothetical protein